MSESTLSGCRILVVEDEVMISDLLCIQLEDEGATVVGPAGSVKEALALVAEGQRIDGAVVDVNLRGELSFPIAEELAARRVPFVFTTGYDGSMIPPAFAHIPRCQKPLRLSEITRAIGLAIHA